MGKIGLGRKKKKCVVNIELIMRKKNEGKKKERKKE
jgi:hypothetical protein